eukprot:SAG31_NODE_25625_length_457_cov_3.776536_1_plen_50_part_01
MCSSLYFRFCVQRARQLSEFVCIVLNVTTRILAYVQLRSRQQGSGLPSTE